MDPIMNLVDAGRHGYFGPWSGKEAPIAVVFIQDVVPVEVTNAYMCMLYILASYGGLVFCCMFMFMYCVCLFVV